MLIFTQNMGFHLCLRVADLRNRGASHGRTGTLSVAETLRAGTVQGVSSPVLRSSASGVAGIFGGARKVEVRTPVGDAGQRVGDVEGALSGGRGIGREGILTGWVGAIFAC